MAARRLRQFVTLLLAIGLCRFASAHPMGNFSVNHYSGIDIQRDRIVIRYFIDLAEIPTYQELQQGDIPATAVDPNAEAVVRYVAARGVELGHGLALEVNGSAIPLHLVSSGVIFPPGAGGLPTMKMGFVYEAKIPAEADHQISIKYVDNNYPGHSGWKEVVASSSGGSLLRASVPEKDRSGELSNYPTDLLSSPPQILEASIVAKLPALPVEVKSAFERTHEAGKKGVIAGVSPSVTSKTQEKAVALPARSVLSGTNQPSGTSKPEPVASAPVLKANQQQTPRNKFTELITAQHLSVWFLFTAAFIAAGLGGMHALEPGHGKTIVAAYLVGSKGTARHAFLLGMIVTASHTAGVFVLGAITLYASRYILPEQLYPWLGVFSGVTIAGLGCYLLLRRLTGIATDHSHEPGAPSAHWTFWKSRGPASEAATLSSSGAGPQSIGMIQLFTLGITGGIVPCPAALIVLLSAFALHRVGLGFFLIVAFSVGLASVLIGFGMMMVYARRFMTHLQIDGPLTKRWLPALSSSFITVLGLILTWQAVASMHIHWPALSASQLGPVLLVSGLGLLLGMRHSTDADHVVAISTIVSKQKSIRNAAFIGSVWGLGHTITIFAVGSLIILFGVEIPPRLGLSMEFSVALMLILLGGLNLTGVMQKITAYFTPAAASNAETAKAIQPAADETKKSGFFAKSVGRLGWYQCARPLAIGLVHGLAGSAAVALLVLSTIHNPIWATVYLLIFGAGTMLGMMCMTAAIAVPLAYAGDRFSTLSRYLGVASGMVSLCFGFFLVYHLGFVGGLFTSHPHWTPQ